MLSSLRTVVARTTVRPSSSIRAFSAGARALGGGHHAPPPANVGEGAQAGEVATDENQSTGLERLQLMGQMKGVDVFNMEPLQMTRQGTTKDPILIPSWSKQRAVGCTGFPADSHDTIWLAASADREFNRCPECGNVYKLDYQGGPEEDHHHH